MGKCLIIKGADFSENGIANEVNEWYVTNGTDFISKKGTDAANLNSAAWTFDDTTNAKLQGKTVNRLRIIASSAGTFNLYVLNSRTQSLETPAATITVGPADIGILKEFAMSNDVSIGAGQILVFASPTQNVSFYYGVNMPNHSFYKRVGFNDTAVVNNYELLFDVGYISSE